MLWGGLTMRRASGRQYAENFNVFAYALVLVLPYRGPSKKMRKHLSEGNLRRASNPDQPFEPKIGFGKQPFRADVINPPNPIQCLWWCEAKLPTNWLSSNDLGSHAQKSSSKKLSPVCVCSLGQKKRFFCNWLSCFFFFADSQWSISNCTSIQIKKKCPAGSYLSAE